MVRREKIEILKEVLTLCQIGVGKTRIVYECNLNFDIVKKYLQWCFLNGWLQKDGKHYFTTKLGIDYLNLITPTVNSLELIKN
jgi:predicted transcriptional regulator